MKRYYLCPVITEQDPDLGTVRRLKLPIGINHSAVIVDGVNWGLAIVAAANHTALVNDSQLDKLPQITMDATLATLTNQQRNTLLNRLTALGVNVSGITTSTPFWEVLRRIGQHLDPNFYEFSFDVSE
jgi:hypothetical protein